MVYQYNDISPQEISNKYKFRKISLKDKVFWIAFCYISESLNIIQYCAYRGYLQILKLLIEEYKFKTNYLTPSGKNLLILSIIGGHMSCLKYIVDNNICNLNFKDKDDQTALHYACMGSKEEMIKYLLENNIDYSIRNYQGQTAEDLVTTVNSQSIINTFNSQKNIGNYDQYNCKQIIDGKMLRGGRASYVQSALRQSQTNRITNTILQKKNKQSESISNFVKIKDLQSGGFSKVQLVRYKKTGQHFALKIMDKVQIKQLRMEKYVIQEKNILELVKGHPFLCQVEFAFQDCNNLYIVLEFIQGEDLRNLLQRKQKIEENVVKFYICELILALEYLHEKNIVYRDLKPENILIGKDGHIKLIDFGLVKIDLGSISDQSSYCGTLAYLSPEMVQRKGHGKAVDWYGLGLVTLELIIGKNPFLGHNQKQILDSIINFKISKPEIISDDAWDFISKLLEKDPKKRMNLFNGDIKKHIWFKDINWEEVQQKKLKMPIYSWIYDNHTTILNGIDGQSVWSVIDPIKIEENKKECLGDSYDEISLESYTSDEQYKSEQFDQNNQQIYYQNWSFCQN